MYPVDPGDVYGHSVIFGQDQAEFFEPLYSRVQEGAVITKWMLSNEDREKIAQGASVFLLLFPQGNPLQPVRLYVEGTASPA